MIRILIADDHAIVRSGLKKIFEQIQDFEVVGEASNANEVIQKLGHDAFDLLLLDLDMPGTSGVDLIVRVRARSPDLPILILSMHNESAVAARAIKAGACGYITKDCDLDILLPAIRSVAAGKTFISPGLAEKMVFEDAPASRSTPHALLSDREMQVFNLLVSGTSVNDISMQLEISNKTVSTHKARMMEKLNLSSMAELMRYAIAHDLIG